MTKKGTRFFILIAALVCVESLSGQTKAPGNTEAAKFRGAANRWMLTPVDVRLQRDSVGPVQRQLRDAFWDGLIGASAPLSQPQTTHRGIAPGGNLTTAPEFPRIPDGVWLIGKFEGYHTFLSASERSVYTEVNIRVQHVFGRRNVDSLMEGTVVDVGRAGGTILAPWGRVISYLVDEPRSYDAQPGHTYLLLLQHHAAGNFYTDVRRWDLTDGVVRPDSDLERYRAEHGKSEIEGLKVTDLIAYLDKRLAD